jgi:hypothetical protein
MPIELYINNFDTQINAEISGVLQTLPMKNYQSADCSAAACIFMKAESWNNLFLLKIQSDSEDIQDMSADDIKYTLDVSAGALVEFIKEVKILNASLARLDCSSTTQYYIDSADIDASYSNFGSERSSTFSAENTMNFTGSSLLDSSKKLVAQDYVRYLAYKVLGNPNSADLFNNESELRSDIQVEGVRLWTTIINKLAEDISLTDVSYDTVMDAGFIDSDSIPAKVFTTFTHAGRIDNTNIMDFSSSLLPMNKFKAGDIITTLFTINSTTHDPTGDTPVTPEDRVYKIKLCLISDAEYSNNMSNGGAFHNRNITGDNEYTVGGVTMPSKLSNLRLGSGISGTTNKLTSYVSNSDINLFSDLSLNDISGADAKPYTWNTHTY